ncbi:MAG: GGDEF domain-containing protein [Dehalococcoidia bacterium]|nr:GGDEF domain-containing protein [Dehalococcoidia bacterium]
MLLLLYIDLDGLKSINDTLGHSQGDLALVTLAMALKSSSRNADIIARIGGDEFAVVTEIVSKVQAQERVTRLRSSVLATSAERFPPRLLSISVGIAIYDPFYPVTIEMLLAQADSLMYEEKNRKKSITLDIVSG